MPETNGERVHISGISPTASLDGKKRRQQPQQARQLLSCTKCRERKVKCDRTKPCTACCARGQPKLCEFVADGGDYAPIQQSYEIRKLRAENQRLKARLRDCNLPIDDDDSDPVGSPDSFPGERPGSSQKRLTSKQKRFQGLDWQDSIYFGSPGLANVITDFASLNTSTTPASLAYLLPRGCDMFTPKSPPPYPFPTIFPASSDECIGELLRCLPDHEAILECFTGFENRVNICSFPHVPLEVTRSEVERFLADDKRNAHVCPEMLALLFAALALVGQHSLWKSCGNKWDANIVSVESRKGDVYIAAAMQALRLASFMHKPSLLSIQALILIAPYLTNSGRFLDAWTLFGTIIRSAHAIGLHRHPKYLDPAPPSQRECSVRQTIWWWILHMDQQYSMTLGRPLGISGVGDCPPPHALTTDPSLLRFGEFVHQFTLLARQILSSDRMTNAKIDEYTDELRGLLETMPETLQFDRSWLMDSKEIPDNSLSVMAAAYHCKTHTYLILLNRQRMEKPSTPSRSAEMRSPITKFRSVNRTHSSHSSPGVTATNFLRGRSLVIASAADVLDAFLFLYLRVQAALVSWDIAQQAFSASIILLIDALELRTTTPGAIKVEKAYIVFQELQEVHKLAASAVERISWGINELHKVTQKQNEAPQVHDHGVHDSEESEAKSKPAIRNMYEDTVMNGTGMMLLEDPGLQGFVSESFAPVQWQAIHSERLRSAHPKDERNSVLNEGKSWDVQSRSSTEDVREARSAEPMQDIRRSTTARSAPTSTTTTPLGDLTPRGSTSYMPHTTNLQTGPQYQKSKATKAHKPSLRRNPPHSQHEAIHHPSNTSNLHRSVTSLSAENSDEGPGAYMNQHLFAATQLRHNSCPSIPFQQPTASIPSGPTHATSCAMDVHDSTVLDFQPPVSNFPENPVSMTAYEQLTTTLDDPDLHRLWGVTPAAWPNRPPSAATAQSIITPQAGINVSKSLSTSDRQTTSENTFVSQGSRIATSANVPEGQYVSMDEWTGWDNGSGA